MASKARTNLDERSRRRLSNATLTTEQQDSVEARAKRRTAEYQASVARDIEAFRKRYPPVVDRELIEALANLRRVRQQQGLSLTDVSERTGIDRGTISKLETGKIANPTIGTLRTYARALGRKIVWSVDDKP